MNVKCQCEVGTFQISRSCQISEDCVRSQTFLCYNQGVQIRLAHRLYTDVQYVLYVLHVLQVYDIELGFRGIAESACIRKTGICVGNWERKIYVAHNAGELGKYTFFKKVLT